GRDDRGRCGHDRTGLVRCCRDSGGSGRGDVRAIRPPRARRGRRAARRHRVGPRSPRCLRRFRCGVRLVDPNPVARNDLGVTVSQVASLVGDELTVPCIDGHERRYIALDAAASTAPLPAVLTRVEQFVPWYSSVHRGAGWKSQLATAAYEEARAAALEFAGRDGRDDVAIICRNTTEAINHLAYRLRLSADDVVATTVVEHHANLLPWSRLARCRYVECDDDGTFSTDAVAAVLDDDPKPRPLA